MLLEMLNPAALAGANRVGIDINGVTTFDDLESTAEHYFPQAVIIARRYHLSPVTARLVCHLAGIGGRA